jgi:hypothetical protein
MTSIAAKPRKIREDSREYNRRYKEVVQAYRPSIIPCKTCGSPRHEQYKCLYCGGE